MRWGAAFAAGILLLGGLTLWWMISGGDLGEVVGPAIVPRPVPLDGARVPRRDARPIATEPLPSEEEVRGHPASGRWLLLRDEGEGRPIAGATVEVLDAGALEQSDAAVELREHLATFEPGSTGEPRWSWRTLVSDPRGLVRLPDFVDRLWVRHRGDQRRALLATVDAEGWQHPVRPLATEIGRWVDVVARRGGGPPVPHALLILARERDDAGSSSVPERYLVTDAEGRGRFWVPEALWGSARVGWLGSPRDEGLARGLDGATSALALELPPCASVAFAFVDGEGARFTGPVLFDLEVQRPGRDRPSWYATNLYAEGGHAVVGGLPLGTRFRVTPQPVDAGFESDALDFAGPLREGETTTVIVSIAQRAPVVRGRFRHTDGRPAAHARIALEVQSPPPGVNGDVEGTWYQEQVLITDGEGRFSASLFLEEPPLGTTWIRATQLEGPRERLGRQGPRCETIREPLLSGINDFGDLTLEAQPVVVAGRVVDEAGEPIEGASIYPAVWHAATAEEEGWWDFWNDRGVKSERDGSFAIFDDTLRGRCRLDVEKAGYLWNRTAPFPTGTGSLEVVLVRGGWLSCRLVLDEGLPLNDVHAVILGPPARNVSGIPGEPADNEMMPGRRSYGDLFMWRGVNAGVATLSVRAFRPEGPELHRVEGIEVRLGEGTEDPRLHPLDLRGRIPVHVVALSDEEGPGLDARARITFIGDPRQVIQVDRGVEAARLILLGSHIHVVVQAPGYASWSGPLGVKRTRARLERAANPVVRLHLPSPLEIPDGAILQVEARLVLENLPAGTRDLGRAESSRPDATGCVRLGLPHPGRYSLELKLWSRADPATWNRLDLGPDPEITIPRGIADHVLSLDIDPKLLNLRMRQVISGG